MGSQGRIGLWSTEGVWDSFVLFVCVCVCFNEVL